MILVAFFHATSHYELNMPVNFLANWFTFGNSGVDFFFVLSGFIIWFIHSEDFGKPNRFKNFAWKRLVRIYPVYWVVLAIRVALFFTAYSAADLINTWEVTKALLLWPARDPIVSVSWTLSHEMLFYSIFGIAILLPKRVSFVLAAAWIVGCVVQTIFPSEHFSLFFLFNHHNLEFAMGAFVGYLVTRRTATHGLAWIFAGTGLFILSGTLWNLGVHEISTTVLFGMPSALIVYGAASFDIRQQFHYPRLLTFLGDASYSIYLVHSNVIFNGMKLIVALGLQSLFANVVGMIVFVAGAVAVGCLFHLLVERPLLNRFRRKKAPRPSREPAVTSATDA